MWHSWQGDGAPDLRVDDGKVVEVKEGGKKRKLSGCDDAEQHLLIRSDRANNTTGYKGVHPHKGRYQVQCNTSTCRKNHLGNFGTPEEGAQAYLQHYQNEHPEELKKERAPPLVLLPVQEHLLIRSDTSSTGYKGVQPHKGRYQAKCNTPPCLQNHLGTFDTSEEAAQAYLQHYQEGHPEELKVQHQYPVEDYPAVLHPQYCLNEVAKWTQKQGVTLPAVTYGCGASHSVLARPRDHPVTRLVEDRLKMTLPGLVSQIQKTANEMKADDYFSKRGDRMEEAKGFERALRSVILKTESPPKSFFSDAEMRQDEARL